MSASQEPSGDLVAVACVVEASLLLASEWSRVLIEYVGPLLRRLNELHPSHQFRLAFVTYGAADTRPHPLLSKRYFAPLAQFVKELREEPSKLGIGQTSSGSGRGLSALEGLVAAIELFDILMMTSPNFNANHAPTQSPQKDNRALVAHLLHIAASPPDNAQRPQCNTLQHLDLVNWDSIPAELRKRKINLSLISLREIPRFQELQSSVAGPNTQSPWFNVHAPHILLLAGFPTPQKMGTKRQSDALPSDQSPDAKRQKVVADSVPKTASPALPPARIPQNQRSQKPVGPQVTQPPPTAVTAPNSSPPQPVQAPASVPASTPATTSPSAPPPSGPSMPAFSAEILDQVVGQTGLTFSQMIERVKIFDKDVQALDAKIANAQSTGQTAILPTLQKDRTTKAHAKEQMKALLRQHYHKVFLAKETPNAQAGAVGSAVPNASAEAGPSTQPAQPPNALSASSERPTGPATDEHKLSVSDSQVLAQFWRSRGGTISAPNGSNPQAGPSQAQPHPSLTPELAAQMQKLIEKKGIRPPVLGQTLQTPGVASHETGVTSNVANNQVIQPFNTWFGTFSGSFPKLGGQVTTELQIHVAGVFTTPMPTEIHTEIRTDQWPKNFTLNPCKEPVKDISELSSWLKRHQSRTRVMQFKPNPRVPEVAINEQKFQSLNKSMNEHRIFAYAGWQLPSGKFSHNIFIFPMGPSFAGAVFPDGLPDLPGSGNALDVQPQIVEAKPQPPLSGLTLPPALMARMQGLEPAKQRQVFVHFLRVQQQEQLRRQQLQQTQTQQAHIASGQAMNPLGMSIPPNPYSAVANIPSGSHANVNAPTMNAGAYNAGGGTVNYEMLQSFMQRNADGSTSQGMPSGSMP